MSIFTKPKANFLMTNEIFHEILTKFFNNEEIHLPTNIEYQFGTNEWADKTFNSHYSCQTGCFYCYAWRNACRRKLKHFDQYGLKTIKKPEGIWNKKWRDRQEPFTIMYPSVHDVTPDIMDDAFITLHNMITAKNVKILFVTKPFLSVMERFIEEFIDNRERFTIRLTIGSDDETQRLFWEGNASTFAERRRVAETLHRKGFDGSVSAEPLLIPKNGSKNFVKGTISFINSLLPFVKNSIWIGLLNHVPVQKIRGRYLTGEEKSQIRNLTKHYTDENILRIVKHYYKNSKIFWKESIKKRMISIIKNTKNKKPLKAWF